MNDDNLLRKQCKVFVTVGMLLTFFLLFVFFAIYYVTIFKRTNVSFYLSSVVIVQISVVALLVIMILIIAVWLMLKTVGMRMSRMVYVDKLTGGMNSEYFMHYVKAQMKSAAMQPYMLQYFEISNIKQINTIYGRLKGDAVLKYCIESAAAAFLPDELCVRLKGSGFILFGHNDMQADDRRSEFILSLNEKCLEAGIKYHIRMRFGVYRMHGNDTAKLEAQIERAEVACPKGVDVDRDLINTYSMETEREVIKLRCIERDKERAIEQKEFKIWMQPKWDFKEKRIAGAEALVRWDHPLIGEILPDDFVPVFEKNGFMDQLDLYVMDAVVHFQGKNKRLGLEVLPISINQSKILFFSPQYVYKIRKIFQENDVPKTCIQIEMKELAFRQEKNKIQKVITELSSDGVQFILDDFGSGNSLATIKDLEFNAVKFDKEFFQQAADSPEQMYTVHKISEMIRSLGIEVTCEGIEDAAQARAANDFGCRYAQGYWYSKPITLEDFREKYCKEISK